MNGFHDFHMEVIARAGILEIRADAFIIKLRASQTWMECVPKSSPVWECLPHEVVARVEASSVRDKIRYGNAYRTKPSPV